MLHGVTPSPLLGLVLAGPAAAAAIAFFAAGAPATCAEWLILVVLVPPLEETIFRGGLQSWLLATAHGRRSSHSITVANLETSVAFALAHGLAQADPSALSVFFPSMAFGWLRDRTGRLAGAILLHGYYNACHLGASALLYNR